MIVATANIKESLSLDQAGHALGLVLWHRPDIVGLQEWLGSRNGLLRAEGKLIRAPRLRSLLRRHYPTSGYVFAKSLRAAPVIGVHTDYGRIESVRRVTLSKARVGVRASHGLQVKVRRHDGQLVPVLVIHLLAHHYDPGHMAGWVEGCETTEDWIDGWTGFPVYVLGDGNKHRLELHGLTSCWDGFMNSPSTFGPRAIDAVWSRQAAARAETFAIGSDHKLVIVRYREVKRLDQ